MWHWFLWSSRWCASSCDHMFSSNDERTSGGGRRKGKDPVHLLPPQVMDLGVEGGWGEGPLAGAVAQHATLIAEASLLHGPDIRLADVPQEQRRPHEVATNGRCRQGRAAAATAAAPPVAAPVCPAAKFVAGALVGHTSHVALGREEKWALLGRNLDSTKEWFSRSVGRSVGWLVGRSVDRSVGRSVDRPITDGGDWVGSAN
jgi:hypothetical protein